MLQAIQLWCPAQCSGPSRAVPPPGRRLPAGCPATWPRGSAASWSPTTVSRVPLSHACANLGQRKGAAGCRLRKCLSHKRNLVGVRGFEPLAPASRKRSLIFNLLNQPCISRRTPVAIALLITTLYDRITRFSHSPVAFGALLVGQLQNTRVRSLSRGSNPVSSPFSRFHHAGTPPPAHRTSRCASGSALLPFPFPVACAPSRRR